MFHAAARSILRPPVLVRAAAGAMLAAPAAMAQFTFTQETVIADGFFNTTPTIAVGEDGSVHVAFMRQFDTDSNSKEIWLASRPPGGGPWALTQITNNAVREEFASLAIDNQGFIHIAFHTGIPGGNHIRYCNNLGGEFTPIIDVTPATGTQFYVIADIATDSEGVVHMTCVSQLQPDPEEAYYTFVTPSPGGGGTPGPLVNISASGANDDSGAHIAVGPDDTVHMTMQRGGAGGGPLLYRRKAPGSLVITPVNTGVAGNVIDPVVLVGPAPTRGGSPVVSIVYRQGDQLWLIDDAGTNGAAFSAPLPLYNDAAYRPAFYEGFGIGADGLRYMCVASNVGSDGIYFVGETEAGVFSNPIRMPGESLTYFGASTRINSSGLLATAYNYGRVDGDNSVSDLFVSLTTIAPPCPADLDGDGVVGSADFALLLGAWGSGGPGDLDGDLVVGSGDLALLLGAWGACP